jgi:hypothetical protein
LLSKTIYWNFYEVKIFTNNSDAVIHDHELGVDVNHEALGLAQERCLAIRRWNLQVLRKVSLTLPVQNNNNSGTMLY